MKIFYFVNYFVLESKKEELDKVKTTSIPLILFSCCIPFSYTLWRKIDS